MIIACESVGYSYRSIVSVKSKAIRIERSTPVSTTLSTVGSNFYEKRAYGGCGHSLPDSPRGRAQRWEHIVEQKKKRSLRLHITTGGWPLAHVFPVGSIRDSKNGPPVVALAGIKLPCRTMWALVDASPLILKLGLTPLGLKASRFGDKLFEILVRYFCFCTQTVQF